MHFTGGLLLLIYASQKEKLSSNGVHTSATIIEIVRSSSNTDNESKTVEKTADLNDALAVILKIIGIVVLIMVFFPVLAGLVFVIQMVLNPDNSIPAMLLIPVF